ncbi:acetate--CoA ligase [Calderihabitans maritimus]|uniref:Acetyl-coenzyme A synthetase n=1 Tax=Calderihabitans maritimus TaxID=1246530 RepID=A0A1Z5HTD3_9FIRM|nr:acetate--CoA ligase [Calderihabitans maritimus]GAW92607.1 acetyl-coenzyme A synthetase [Calderihabitans maritimus]
MEAKTLEALLKEERVFSPPEEFVAQANVKDDSLYKEAAEDRLGFWAKQAERIDWFQKWDKVLDWDNPPFAKWFVNGKLNASYNCVDRHVKTWRRNKAAIIWEGEPGDSRVLTYQDLYREVNKFANVLKSLGVKKGDRVTLYLPMIPELPIAMLACARIGAPHSVVFGGFSAESLRDRINDAEAKILITADAGWRRGNVIPLKQNADQALQECPSIEKVIVVERVGEKSGANMVEGRDLWWHDLMKDAPAKCEPEPMDAEDMLYILYTSGTTGKPKGVVHTTGGYLVGVATTHYYIFDIKEEDVYWCTADIGWVTGHSYIVYGPLANGCTTVMYEGSPDYPDRDRFWRIVEKYGVTILYTAPTAIRAFMKWGTEYPGRCDLSTLRLLGTVGEPINPEAWMWYHKYIGRERCPIVDTWWQTETGMILISPLPGVTKTKPGTATIPFPGVEADVVDDNGNPASSGYLVLKSPWPAMLRTIFRDPERFKNQYWSRFEGIYFTGDGAKRDEDGYIWVLGRVDDVINVSGHRIGTMEVESALVDHPSVAEAAVIGKTHELKGQAISAFVTLKEGVEPSEELAAELKAHVAKKIGALARPEDIFFTAELPKTRSGKIMRRLLRDIAEGRALGDTTTLADPSVVQALKEKYEEKS